MTWEKRGKSDYYYRKCRIGKRIVSTYLGKGHIANLIAEQDQILHEIKNKVTHKNKQKKELEKEWDRKLDSIESEVFSLVNSILLVSGYRTHKGQWRKCHERDHSER